MAAIEIANVTKLFPGDVVALDDVSLRIGDGEFIALVGPSGCGKSTLLRSIAGLEDVTSGEISIGGRDVTDLAPRHRDIAMVFQSYALYPHMTVRQNLGYGLKVRRTPKAEIRRRVEVIAELLGLDELLERRPAQLSGGQRQRVAMGRAIVRQPSVFLMDEPLSNLDAKLRVQMRADIAALQADFGITTVYVTHDQAEAMTLGHRVAVLDEGRLQQCGPPRVLYERPVNVFVAGFIGSPAMNLCTVHLKNGTASFGGVDVPIPQGVSTNGQTSLVLGVRPEALEVAAGGVPARVDVIEDVGADAFVFCTTEVDGESMRLVARTEVRNAPKQGERVTLRPRADEAHLFDPATGERLGAP